ncbi:RRXRR domain-containing protein, partial [Clostridioides sp. ZZV14-6345]|uniref:RRXRR domain-containing protein n=1 Tax=Clostridioides sp. ZZV14-6345 TaxID=2811496 RepID=UPI001DE04558|nr:RRXRR domain-containing protein [Clostridioides sp. ZZV14-6345]
WNNRKIKQGWLAPSLQHKLNTHLKFIDYLNSILPIRNIVIEVANFDIQKIKNPDISGVEYQQGEQMSF